MNAVVEANGLGKRYGRRWALADCTLAIPAGRVVGLVGPNGAGKTTLLQLAAGLLAPTTGTISVLGGHPAGSPAQLRGIGFVAQDTPAYAGLSAPRICAWAGGSTRAGTASWPSAASVSSASTCVSGPGPSPAASAPSSR